MAKLYITAESDRWKRITLSSFGKASKASWSRAMVDIQCVDNGLKPSCLFDHWSVCQSTMVSYLIALHTEGLVSNHLKVLVVGLDVVVYSLLFKNLSKSSRTLLYDVDFVDITSTLAQPSLISDTVKLSETKTVFDHWCHQTDSTSPDSSEEIKITGGLNVPTLFGLLLGYPCVYWYDTAMGEENNLSGFALRLFQVKGVLKSYNMSSWEDNLPDAKSGKLKPITVTNSLTKDGGNGAMHIIYSFTVPEILTENVRDKIWAWYQAWENSVPWSDLFSKVAMVEQSTTPAVVCL